MWFCDLSKCDLSNVSDTLETHIELISLKSDGLSRIEHQGKDYDGKYNLGFVENHYFLNDYTELTSYSLENYEEIKDLKESSTICKKYYERDKTGKRFITSFQLFKILMGSTVSLITPMELTCDIMSTQFYDRVDDYKTLDYNKKNCRLEEYVEKYKDHYNIFF